MIGRSAAMQPVYRAISRFAAGNLPVLIQGEVGTGKDLVAKLLHEGGVRRKLPFLRETDFENISLTLQKVNGGDIYIDENQREEILQEMGEKGYVESLEQCYKTKKGKEFSAILSVKPIVYQGQDAYIGMVVDITKQKKIEAELRDVHKHTRESIEYASLIQGALIPNNNLFNRYFS